MDTAAASSHSDLITVRLHAIAADLASRGIAVPIENLIRRIARAPVAAEQGRAGR